MKNKILIIGKIPPPIGGVTVHVSRLVETLTKRKYPGFHFYDLQKGSLWKLFLTIFQYRAAHLHASSPYFQLIVAVFCRLLRIRLVITYHGNWGRYGILKNITTSVSSRLAFIPVLQNQDSFVQSQRSNKRSVLISAFIPPLEIQPLAKEILQRLDYYKRHYKYVFCTNASNLTFDKDGEEIYGISDLVKNFSQTADSVLIISDPSGNNKKNIENNFKQVPDNVYFTNEKHDFWNILKLSDAFIRNTTTDGDSISIHEAICCNKPVFATSFISRPLGCSLFSNVSRVNFEEELKKLTPDFELKSIVKKPDTVTQLLIAYKECLL